MSNDLSDVPCVGSEQVHPIDGRQYGQIPIYSASPSASPDGQHEVAGTESFQLSSSEEWLAELVSRETAKGGLT